MQKLPLVEVGDSVGFVLPPEVLERLQLAVGQPVYLIESDTGFVLTPNRPADATPADANGP
jgi:antitoxin component of MazEF toxin-antitoxin module